MKDSGANAFLPGYNAQIAVDGEAQVIVAAAITSQVNDKEQLLPMVALVKAAMGREAETVLADAGYWNAESVTAEAVKNVQVVVPPDGHVTRRDHAMTAQSPPKRSSASYAPKVRRRNGAEAVSEAARHRGTGVRANQGTPRIPANAAARDR